MPKRSLALISCDKPKNHETTLSFPLAFDSKTLTRLLISGLLAGLAFTLQGQTLTTTPERDRIYATLLELQNAGNDSSLTHFCRKQLSIDPDFYPIYPRLATAAQRTGEIAATRIFLTRLAQTHPMNPFVFYGRGLLEQEADQPLTALDHYKQALILKPDFFPAVLAAVRLATQTGNADAWETFFKKEITTHPRRPDGYFGRGVLFAKSGRNEEALDDLMAAIERNSGSWITQYQIGDLLYTLSRYSEALTWIDASLGTATQDPYAELEGRILGLKALTLWNLDRYAEALPVFQEAINFLLNMGDQRYAGVVTGNMGLVYMYQWNYPQALNTFQKALKIHRQSGYRIAEGLTLNNIGLIYLNSSHYTQALKYFKQAEPLFHEERYLRGTAIIQANLGAVYNDMGNYDQALTHYQKALAIRRESLPNQRDEGILLTNMGNLYLSLNDNLRAEKYLRQALELYQDTGQTIYQGHILNLLGQVVLQRAGADSARICYQKALDMGRDRALPQLVWEAYYGLGMTYEQEEKLEQAENYYRQAITGLESTWRSLALDELKVPYLGNRIAVYHSMIRLLYSRNRDSSEEKLLANSFHLAERTKARSFLDMLVASDVNVTTGIDPEFLQSQTELENQLDSLQTVLALETNTQSRQSVLREWEAIRHRQENLAFILKRRYQRYGQLKYPEPLTIDDVQRQLLNDNTVFLEYLVGDSVSYLWAVSSHSSRWIRLPGEAVLRDRIQVLRRALEKPELWEFSIRLSYRLYQDLISPVRSFLDSARYVMISPDGPLHYLSFELLNSTATDVYHPLMEDFVISYTPSATVLAYGFQPDSALWTRSWLGVGDPQYTAREQAQLYLTESGDLLTGPFSDTTLNTITVERLPYSGEEIANIAQLFPANSVDVLLREQATETRLKQSMDLTRYAGLHLVGHGFIMEDKPSYSGILLTLNDNSRDDGLLQVREIFNLRLNADLVVLSACRTGLGKLTEGEGIIGLSRALLYAGTSALVVSLWPVPDASTAQFMAAFYRNLVEGQSKADALRDAKRILRQNPHYRSPYYWAPFILIGDGSAPFQQPRF